MAGCLNALFPPKLDSPRLEPAAWFWDIASRLRLKTGPLVIAILFLLRASQGQTLTDLGAAAPAPGANDLSQLLIAGQANKPDGLNYYTDNTTEPGQTFTTGTNGGGYQLNYLALKTGGGTTQGAASAQNYSLHIYSVNSGTATLIATYSATNFVFVDGDWLQWSGLQMTLSSNAVYAYAFGKASDAVYGWEAMGNASPNPYTGGELGLVPVAGGAITFGSSHNYDGVFDIGLTPTVPGPAAVANTPATGVQAGSATLNGNIVSIGSSVPQVTIYYGTNNGGMNARSWSNSVALGAQSGSFSAAVKGLQAGTAYYFTAQASNSAGVTWAAPSANFSTPTVTILPVTLADLGTNTPVPGLYDLSQLLTTGQVNMPDHLNYYTDNQSDHAAGEPGQIFTTPGGTVGFLLNTVAIKTGGGTTSGTGAAQGYLLHLYLVTGYPAGISSNTLLATYSATNFNFADGDWLQWSGLNLSLSPNSVYAYSFGKVSSAVAGWEQLGNAGDSPFSGGELGLFPVAGGPVTLGASHSFAGVFNLGLSSAGPPTVATITNLPATTVQATTAMLNGKITFSGGRIPSVSIFYGPGDGGTNVGGWSNNVATGPQLGAFSAAATGLKTNTTYFFTAQASNSVGISWAVPSQYFVTAASVTAPAVTNLPAAGVAAFTASMNGQVLDTGNEQPGVLVYYGTTDGGTNPAAWASHASVGVQSGLFSLPAAGLLQSTKYYYNAFASNSAGFGWGGPSQSFTTLTLTKISVLTYHYDNTRQGQNPSETLLSPANVNPTNFGKLFAYPVDGYVYAQPLIVTNLNLPGKGVRDVLFVATMNDSVYAFDANNNGDANGGLLWMTNVGVASPSPSPEYGTAYHSVGNLDVVPEEGMAAAPVIDPVSGTMYLDAFTREVVAGVSTNYFHRIHALNITNGTEQPYSPVVVTAAVPGTGLNGNGTGTPQTQGTTVTFSAIQHMERPALTLAGGVLYLAYGSHDDTEPYHGWVFGYNPANLAQVSVFNTTPNASEGSIWMSGDGLCVDLNTNLYFETANGTFDANLNGGDYSQSFVKLSTAANHLVVTDYFTPYNQASLSSGDSDVGSGGPLLLPDSVGSTNHPHLLVGAGKEGTIYLVDRDSMGKYNSASDSQIVQELSGAIGGAWSSPAYFDNRIYYNGDGDVLKAFLITNGVIVATPDSTSAAAIGFPGATPTISANGTNQGIAWVIDDGAYLSSGPAVLHAYNATNLAIELYNSSQNLSRDNPGPAVKMVPPVIAGGKVYVAAQYDVSVFGPAAFLPAPTISPTGGAFIGSVTVTLADSTPGVSLYYTLDGTTPTTSSPIYNGPLILTTSALVQAIAATAGAVNSAVANASFVNTAASGTGSGLTGAYYASTTSASPFAGLPVLVQTNATINFNWGTNGPNPAVGATNFTVRWTGSVQPQFSEPYTFSTTADDGVRLYINGQLLINDWVDQTNATTRTNRVALVAQQLYNLELDYFQNTNTASVALSWSSPSTPLAIVPQTQLYPFTNPPPTVVLLSPANNASYTASASVTLSADADTPYNVLSAVSFYANSTLLGSVTNPPYTLTATGLAAGSYTLTVTATDGSGLITTSAPANLTVAIGSGLAYGLITNGTVPAFFNLPTTFNGALPPLLSLTGVYSDTPNRVPAGGLIPYVPNTPLWSDGAAKSRYLAVPNTGGSITPGQQITFTPTGTWSFPAGTVFVKNFDLVVNATNPSIPLLRLETRLLVRDINGAVYGVTYKWRADNRDADLLTNSLSETILITNATGLSTQTWYYPSPADCLQCHTSVANYVLGVNSRQLNGSQTYPATGVTDNQLRTLNQLGLFNPAFDEASITNFEKLSALTNLAASLPERSRSYLDANCAQCHQPGGSGITFDARYDTPLANQNLTNYPAAISLGFDNACIIKAQDVWRSTVWQRINTTNNSYKMPPLARALIDTNAVQVFTSWINSLPGTPALPPPAITPNGGDFIASAQVTLQSPVTNTAIYYTLDGSLPTTNSTRYAGAFNLFTNATVSANAFATNFNNSVAASALFFVQPLYFASSGFLTNGQFLLNFIGVPGSNYVLQATTNFSTWTPVSTNNALTNQLNLFDPAATNFPYRFYRAKQQ